MIGLCLCTNSSSRAMWPDGPQICPMGPYQEQLVLSTSADRSPPPPPPSLRARLLRTSPARLSPGAKTGVLVCNGIHLHGHAMGQ